MALLDAGLYSRFRQNLPEMLRFCVVGGLGAVIDLGGAAVLHSKYHVGPLEAKAISTTAATVFTYVGSRFWTFKHRENQALGREATTFIVLNLIGLLIAEVVVGFVTYVLAMRGQLEYNAASVIGTGLATIFRYWAYRKWVFLAPASEPVGAAQDPGLPEFPDYPPWELDSSYLAPASTTAPAPVHLAWGVPGAVLDDSMVRDENLLRDDSPVLPNGRPDPAAGRAPGRHRRQQVR